MSEEAIKARVESLKNDPALLRKYQEAVQEFEKASQHVSEYVVHFKQLQDIGLDDVMAGTTLTEHLVDVQKLRVPAASVLAVAIIRIAKLEEYQGANKELANKRHANIDTTFGELQYDYDKKGYKSFLED